MKIASTPTKEEFIRSRVHSYNNEPVNQYTNEPMYRYGWREIPRILPNGKKIYERVPLTLEDILHPQVGDFRMQSAEHEQLCTYLRALLRERVADDPNAVVLGDVLVSWAYPGIRGHGPDIAVIFNVEHQQNWSTFDEVNEGTKPSLIIEVTSPSTYSVDLEKKVDHYAQVGVELYVIADIAIRRDMPRKHLLGYQLTPNGYEPLEPNANGWLWLAPVNLWLGWYEENIACYDADGNLMGDYTTVVNSRIKAEEQADSEKERADGEAQARVAAEQRATKAEQRATEAEQRATEAEQRANNEAQTRRELEAELHRLRGDANNK